MTLLVLDKIDDTTELKEGQVFASIKVASNSMKNYNFNIDQREANDRMVFSSSARSSTEYSASVSSFPTSRLASCFQSAACAAGRRYPDLGRQSTRAARRRLALGRQLLVGIQLKVGVHFLVGGQLVVKISAQLKVGGQLQGSVQFLQLVMRAQACRRPPKAGG
ncbi:hypothetical protein PF006_g9433 [Phytophthora fragariae]|uniref:Uncharacterized protein n=1 Tax=Phytophthora fragariae TaxID=53985 RepID=A0A6A3U2M5_9STRA|nr:hypothetical protein PF003_g1678 [Phytophthora fragariae]KAE9145749.1 hypothetical protein PF006_g9433 [Phytophthora fragariae]